MNQRSRIGIQNDTGEDRLSHLPDEVIHQILSILGIRFAVQTSILSKRWWVLWKTLPFCNFYDYEQLFPYTHSGIIKFIDHVLSNRDHQTNLYVMRFKAVYPFPRTLIERLVEYVIAHNVEELDIDLLIYRHNPCKLSTFSSDTIKKLKLGVFLDFFESLDPDSCWDLPALTDLHLSCSYCMSKCEISQDCLICLPALTTLSLDGFELPESFSLPALINLRMNKCKLPKKADYDIPALVSLELEDVSFPDNASHFFSALTSVRKLTMIYKKNSVQEISVCCPQLVSISISTTPTYTFTGRIVVTAPKLREFYSVGIFPVLLRVREFQNLDIKFWDTNEYKDVSISNRKKLFRRLIPMLGELGKAKILSIDSATIEALSLISSNLRRVDSPFINLQYVKLPQGKSGSRLSTTLRKYLIGGATVVTFSPQNNENHQLLPVRRRS